MTGTEGHIRIGTSGWNYKGWRGPFYDAEIAEKDWLGAYAARFSTVEVNNSFYNLPSRKSIASWVDRTPPGFIFACKASRYITHMKKLKDPAQSTQKFFAAMEGFGDRMGPVLFQLPPRWHFNGARLAAFLEALPGGYRYCFEFRDRSWLCEEAYDLLRRHNAALCFYDFKTFSAPEIETADFIYVRLHGPQETPYAGSYDADVLADYARKCRDWAKGGKDVYCYFDNDQKARAPFDARDLIARL